MKIEELKNKYLNAYWKRILTVTVFVLVIFAPFAIYAAKNNKNVQYDNQKPASLEDRESDGSNNSPGTEESPASSSSPSVQTNPATGATTGRTGNQSGTSQSSSSSSASDSGTSQTIGDSGSEGSDPDPVIPGSDPVPESSTAYVAFYADSQSDTDEEDVRHQKVVDRILATSANPIFHGGDLMEDGTQNSLDRFNNVTTTLRATRTFYSALGNNDRVYGDSSTPSQLFLDNFVFPNNERWYSVNTGNLHLIVLDSAFCSSCQSQLDWLASDLQSSASQSRITGVVYHHPTYTSTISSYLINYGVDFVIQGHIHAYSHTISNGINFFIMPGGNTLGYGLANIFSTYLTISIYNENGGLIESATISER